MITSYYNKDKKLTPKQKAGELLYDAMDKMVGYIDPDMTEGMTEKEKEQMIEQLVKYANRVMIMAKMPERF